LRCAGAIQQQTGDFMSLPTRNWLTRNNAQDLADKIKAYWAERGKTVHMRVEPIGYVDALFDIRSDMLNGKPRF
jgi:hypothetical protein